MLFHLRPANYMLWALAVMASLVGLSSFSLYPASFHSSILPPFHPSNKDSIQYRGYRLELTNFEVLKRNDDWVKLRFNIVNSGRVDVDFSKKGTEHWVQFQFDQSIFEQKLGGLRQNIQQVLQQEGFKLPVGKMEQGKELKVPVLIQKKQEEPSLVVAGSFETRVGGKTTTPETPASGPMAPNNGIGSGTANSAAAPGIAENCPDIYFQRLQIIEQDDKWATIEFTIANKGFGPFKLYEKSGKQAEHVLIKSFISGVPTLSRGALPTGEQMLKPNADHSGELAPGSTFTTRIKVDVRKKTRYMKSLILSLDSDQFKLECDKTNNTGAVILD